MPSCLSYYLSEAHHQYAGAYSSTCAEDRVRRWVRPLPVLTALYRNKNGLVNCVGFITCPSPPLFLFCSCLHELPILSSFLCQVKCARSFCFFFLVAFFWLSTTVTRPCCYDLELLCPAWFQAERHAFPGAHRLGLSRGPLTHLLSYFDLIMSWLHVHLLCSHTLYTFSLDSGAF